MTALLIIPLVFTSCEEVQKKWEVRSIAKKWIGKEIIFPDSVPCSFSGRETSSAFCEQMFNTPFKLLVYLDSTGCSDYRLKLYAWKELILEADSLFPGRLSFLFYFQPKANNSEAINYLFRSNRFKYPVFWDENDQLDHQNKLPQKVDYQCFLLDEQNKVVLIGNPMINPQMWQLFKNAINSVDDSGSTPITTLKINKTLIDFGQIKQKGIYKASFEFENTGNNPLIIQQVYASCGCTEVIWEKQPIRPKTKTVIKIELRPNEPGFFYKSVLVYANVKDAPIRLFIKGSVVD